MKSLNISVDSWIIQDGNYDDFTVGQNAQFALEFFSHSLTPSNCAAPAMKHLGGIRYQICSSVEFCESDVWVLNMGVLCYRQDGPPEFVTTGAWVEGELSLGIDPFYYFEDLRKRSAMPALIYSFRVDKILLETTPWLTKSGEFGGEIMQRDERRESYREVPRTNAWNDDNGNAHYILSCSELDGPSKSFRSGSKASR